MAGADFIIEEAFYVDQLAWILRQGGRLYYSISANGEPVLAQSHDDIADISSRDYIYIIIKHPSFANDVPYVSLIEGKNASWYIFDSLKGGGHLLLTAKRFSDLAYEYYYITIGYGSFFVDIDGSTIGPERGLVKLYRTISSRFRGRCTKRSLSVLKSSMVSREMIEKIPNWLALCRTELDLKSPVSLGD